MAQVDPASVRDPYGRVIQHDGRIFRVLNSGGAANEALLRSSGLLDRLESAKLLIQSRRVEPVADIDVPEGGCVLEHPPVPVITYPYEWSFSALKAAALDHLDLQLMALAGDATLTDASAYNVQFMGTAPLFIDVTSLRPRAPGEYWLGYRQFREQFLNPLLMTAYGGLPFNALYAGSIGGIEAGYVRRLLPWLTRWRPRTFLHVVLPDMVARRPHTRSGTRKRGLSAASFGEMLRQLRGWIAALTPRWAAASAWSGYESASPYTAVEAAKKNELVTRTVAAWRPPRLLDLGCNTGAFSLAAWRAGAGLVVGLDSDAQSVDRAFHAGRDAGAAFLPLVVNITDPSTARGWRGTERRDLIDRVRPDAVMALALAHHVALTGIPLAALLEWLVEIAPRGIVEFIPPDDPMLAGMLADRGVNLRDYSREIFLARLGALARIEQFETLTASGRVLAVYERT